MPTPFPSYFVYSKERKTLRPSSENERDRPYRMRRRKEKPPVSYPHPDPPNEYPRNPYARERKPIRMGRLRGTPVEERIGRPGPSPGETKTYARRARVAWGDGGKTEPRRGYVV